MALLEVLVFVVIFFVVRLTLYGAGRRRGLGRDWRRAHDDVLLALEPVLRRRHSLLASGRHGGREERVQAGRGDERLGRTERGDDARFGEVRLA